MKKEFCICLKCGKKYKKKHNCEFKNQSTIFDFINIKKINENGKTEVCVNLHGSRG